jgi:hypothetical protein
MNIFTTIQSKYQGETIFCFVCVATVFGYILGVNKVIDAIITKHSDEMRVKVVQKLNKYTQTNLSDLAELLASNHIILSTFHKSDNHNHDNHNHDNYNHDNNDENDVASNHTNTNDEVMNYDTNDEMNETSENVKCEINPQPDQEKQESQESQQQENLLTSPSSTSTSSIISTTEEDYELVKKNENNNQSKNKNNMKYFEWFNINIF